MAKSRAAILGLVLSLLCAPALAQFTILDRAQDGPAGASDQQPRTVTPPPGPDAAQVPPVCGNQPFAIASGSWPSATLLAQIHALVLEAAFACEVRIVPGDPGATISSMASTGQPALAPEIWAGRIAEVWNGAVDAQTLRSAAPTYVETSFEGWFMPRYLADSFTGAPAMSVLREALPLLLPGEKMRLISCPADWACAIINHNLVAAYGLESVVEVVEPANRLEMDRLIAEGVSRREPFLFYYWQPNAILAQLDFTALEMGTYDEAAMKCLASRSCADPQPSAFAPELVVMALAERVFVSMPAIAAYFQRASLSLTEMNGLLAALNLPGATPQSVAERFVAERGDLWRTWLGSDAL